MPNPYYVEPANPVPGFQNLLQGLLKREENIKTVQAEQQKKELLGQAANIINSGNPEAIASFMTQNPEIAQQVQSAYKFKSDATRQNMIDTIKQVVIGNSNSLQNIIDRAEMVINEGGDATDTISFGKKYIENPEEAKQDAMKLWALYEPESYKAYISTLPEPEKPTKEMQNFQFLESLQNQLESTIDPKEKAFLQKKIDSFSQGAGFTESLPADWRIYQLAKQEGFDGDFSDYMKIKSGGIGNDLKLMELQLQLQKLGLDIEAKKTEQEEKTTQKKSKITGIVSSMDNVMSTVDSAISLIKKNPSLAGMTGIVQAKIPGTDAYKLSRTLDTIKSNIGFDKLQAMRDASPTGGALGQVSERENTLLQSTIANIDQGLSYKDLINNLTKIKTHYGNWKQTVLPSQSKSQSQETSSRGKTPKMKYLESKMSKGTATSEEQEEYFQIITNGEGVKSDKTKGTVKGKGTENDPLGLFK